MKTLYALFLLDVLSFTICFPVFSAFISAAGGGPFTLGLINSSGALISLLWNLIAGSLSDQMGRKGLLIKCIIANSIGSLIMCIFSSSLILVFVGKLIGAFGSPTQILLRSTVTDMFRIEEEKNHFFNKIAPIASAAFIMGSLGGGFLSEVKNGYALTFLLMAAITGLAGIVAQIGLPEDSKPKDESKENIPFAKMAMQELNAVWTNLKSISWPRYQKVFVMKGLFDFGMCTIFSNFGYILAKEFQLEGRYTGYVFFVFSIVATISNILKLRLRTSLGNIPDHLKIIRAGIALVISFLGMSLSGSVYTFLFFMSILSVATAFMDGFWTEMITSKTLDNDRGKVIAAFDNLNPLMFFIAPLISGLTAEVFGERLLLAFASLPATLAMLIAYKYRNKTD